MRATRIPPSVPAGQAAPPRRQRGVVLFVALIVMVALSLAAIALIRSVDTTNAIVGNLAFRLASILPANASVEQAAAALFSDADIAGAIHIPDKNHDLTTENYFAHRVAGEDARGVPAALQTKAAASTLTKKFDANDTFGGAAPTDTQVTYVIERMCLAVGSPTTSNCDLVPPKGSPGNTLGDAGSGGISVPFYRITVRVDGPKNTASFVQAMLK